MIVIDAGHGGRDRGCVGGGLVEKDLTLQLANILGNLLSASCVPYAFTRDTDETLGLSSRATRANAAGATQIISLHFDTNKDKHVGRTTFYVRPADAQSRALAGNIGRCISPTLAEKITVIETSPDGWRHRANNVLAAHAPTPALLIECAFLSNATHAAYLSAPHGLAAIATAVACGVNVTLSRHVSQMIRGDLQH